MDRYQERDEPRAYINFYNPHLTTENVDSMSEQEKYDMLSGDIESEIVVLHCHGGAFMYCSLRYYFNLKVL
jgi:acetyl esterase/lipase